MQQKFIRDIVSRLEALSIPYAIGGSIASNYWGIPRLTHDVDIVVVLNRFAVSKVAASFPDPFYVSEAAIREAIQSKSIISWFGTRSHPRAAS